MYHITLPHVFSSTNFLLDISNIMNTFVPKLRFIHLNKNSIDFLFKNTQPTAPVFNTQQKLESLWGLFIAKTMRVPRV